MAHNANIRYVHQDGISQITYGPPFARPDHTMQGGSTSNSKKDRRFSRVLLWMGVSEVVLGTLQCIICIASLIIADKIGSEAGVTQVSPGIWCSIFLIVSGVFGILGGKYPTVAFYGVNIGMCVMAAIFMGILVILSSSFAIVEDPDVLKSLHLSLAIFGFIGLVFSIVHSAFTCAGCCCPNSSRNAVPPQPVTYPSHFIHPIRLPYLNAPGYTATIPPQPQVAISGNVGFCKQEASSQLPPPPYSP